VEAGWGYWGWGLRSVFRDYCEAFSEAKKKVSKFDKSGKNLCRTHRLTAESRKPTSAPTET